MHILNQHLTLNYSCISAEPLCADLNRLFSVSSDAEIYVLGSYKKMADKRKLQGLFERVISCQKKSNFYFLNDGLLNAPNNKLMSKTKVK